MRKKSGPPLTEKIYHIISATFCVIVVLSNIISAKLVALPYVGFSIPAGLITYPFTFLLSGLVTEFFGTKKASFMVYVALGMNLVCFGIIELALWLPSETPEDLSAFQAVLGLSGLRIFASLVAYTLAQLADIHLYAWIKVWTGPRFLWLRNNGSICLSQLIDTLAIDLIFLYWGLGIDIQQVVSVMAFSYVYKAVFSLLSTPLFYVCVFVLQKKKEVVKQLYWPHLLLARH
jgi:uncharacterized integral membrane protein (TIGR00697 family)